MRWQRALWTGRGVYIHHVDHAKDTIWVYGPRDVVAREFALFNSGFLQQGHRVWLLR